jgi:hypothetical protein
MNRDNWVVNFLVNSGKRIWSFARHVENTKRFIVQRLHKKLGDLCRKSCDFLHRSQMVILFLVVLTGVSFYPISACNHSFSYFSNRKKRLCFLLTRLCFATLQTKNNWNEQNNLFSYWTFLGQSKIWSNNFGQLGKNPSLERNMLTNYWTIFSDPPSMGLTEYTLYKWGTSQIPEGLHWQKASGLLV